MATVVLLAITGLGLAALYFLVASGLSLIFGLMGVLNFAHGAFLTIGAYGTWWAAENLPGAGSTGWGFVLAVVFGVAVGTLVAALIELALIRPLYERHIEQVLVTVGLSLALVALVRAIWGADPHPFPRPEWTQRTTSVLGANVSCSSGVRSWS
jgi:branched-chain amino acid transport system permease protein